MDTATVPHSWVDILDTAIHDRVDMQGLKRAFASLEESMEHGSEPKEKIRTSEQKWTTFCALVSSVHDINVELTKVSRNASKVASRLPIEQLDDRIVNGTVTHEFRNLTGGENIDCLYTYIQEDTSTDIVSFEAAIEIITFHGIGGDQVNFDSLYEYVLQLAKNLVEVKDNLIAVARDYTAHSYMTSFAWRDVIVDLSSVPIAMDVDPSIIDELLRWETSLGMVEASVREAIKNMIKHNGPEQIQVRVQRDTNAVIVSLEGINVDHVITADDIALFFESMKKHNIVGEANHGDGAVIMRSSGADIVMKEGTANVQLTFPVRPLLYLSLEA